MDRYQAILWVVLATHLYEVQDAFGNPMPYRYTGECNYWSDGYSGNNEMYSSIKAFTNYISETKPNFSCLLFGQTGCEIACGVMCLAYNCQSTASCRNGLYCECHETYHMDDDDINSDYYQELIFDELWPLKFETSKESRVIASRIKDDNELQDYVLDLLRNNHVNGYDIKSRLQRMHPEWKQLQFLRPTGIDINADNVGDHVTEMMNEYDFSDVETIDYRERIILLIDQTTNDDDLWYILDKIRLIGDDDLYQEAVDRCRQNGYNFVLNGDPSKTEHSDLDVNVVNELLSAKNRKNREPVKITIDVPVSYQSKTNLDHMYDNADNMYADEIPVIKNKNNVVSSNNVRKPSVNPYQNNINVEGGYGVQLQLKKSTYKSISIGNIGSDGLENVITHNDPDCYDDYSQEYYEYDESEDHIYMNF